MPCPSGGGRGGGGAEVGVVTSLNRLRPEARGRRGQSSDQRNAAFRVELDQARTADAERVNDDHRAKIERKAVTVSLAAYAVIPAQNTGQA